MAERGIDARTVRVVLEEGELIAQYPDDTPFASRLVLGWVNDRAVHVVAADNDAEEITVVITAYEPDTAIWTPTSGRGGAMKCVIRKQGETRSGVATVALARGPLTMVFKAVPAEVCDNCGEEYLADDVTTALLEAVEASARSGVEVEVREYARGA